MKFLKKHYEKIILSAVLLALGATAVWFYGAVEEAGSKDLAGEGSEPPAKPWKALDLTPERKALTNFNNPPELVLSSPHNLFNPLTWKMVPDGTLVKIPVEGPAALFVTNITPIYFTISFDRKAGESYMLTVTPPSGRSKSGFSRVGEKDKSKPYVITGTNDAPDGKTILTLNITDTGETVNVTTNKPYQRIESYLADLRYPPDTAVFLKRRVNDMLSLSGAAYKIIAITSNAVTVQNTNTSQQTPIEWNGAH